VSLSHGAPLGWLGIARLGLIQASLGAIVVLATSTVNRVMAVELALPALVPGALVAWHYAVQILRPRMGYGSDQGGRRAPWIIGGQIVLAVGGVTTALAVPLLQTSTTLGLLVSFLGFSLVGIGAGTCGTTLLVLLAKRVNPVLRPAAATIVWVMMIAGMAFTAIAVSRLLDPFSAARLIEVVGGVAVIAVALTAVALWGVEGPEAAQHAPPPEKKAQSFVQALAEVWAEPQARALTLFIFVSMLAYNAQELILEPFAGHVFGRSVGATAKITGMQHAGALVGMVLAGTLCTVLARRWPGTMRVWTIGGCLGSGAMLLVLAASGFAAPDWPLDASVFVLGIANGAFAVAAISAMMTMVGHGTQAREGTRMGIWGAAQAVAFAMGGLVATASSDLARALLGSPQAAYAAVFLMEAVLFVVAAWLAIGVFRLNQDPRGTTGSDHAGA
jgi:BCD family chlorophyll transporter-like MFS transporter